MRSAIKKSTLREIKNNFGRYVAIIAIIALGVGFFSGLKNTKPAMVKTGDKYISNQNMYDFRLISGLGFTAEDAEKFASLDGVEYAEGGFFSDFLYSAEGKNTGVLRAHLMNKNINKLSVVRGRLPEKGNEVIVDAHIFSDSYIGKTIKVSAENTDSTKSVFKYDEYTIVGTCNSVYYLNVERGTTSLSGGTVSGFVYMTEDALDFDVYTEMFLTLDSKAEIFSEKYDSLISSNKENVTSALEERAALRYEDIVSSAREKIESSKKEFENAKSLYEAALFSLNEKTAELEKAKEQYNALAASGMATEEMLTGIKAELDSSEKALLEYKNELKTKEEELSFAEKEINDAEEKIDSVAFPFTYVFTRNENTGYACYENDSSIVDGIAKVFPLFFFMVAALVCITTMTRMVEEQRTQIGTLKALGYRSSSIAWKYIFYSGSAAVIGCLLGFFLCTWLFPAAIWKAYNMLYDFAKIEFVFKPTLLLISVAVSLICSVVTAYISVRKELSKMPAVLMRPKAPKPGKRIFLEKIGFIWGKMKFLHKVSARNILRYKKRMFMMILGIGGCTALVLTGLGIGDSISNIAEDQYGNILKYDYSVTLEKQADSEFTEYFKENTNDILEKTVFIKQTSVRALAKSGGFKNINLIVSDDENITSLIDLHMGEKKIAYPSKGEAVLTEKFASEMGLSVGDTITVFVDDTKRIDATVSGICENYVYGYVYINAETYEDFISEPLTYNTVLATAKNKNDIHGVSAKILSLFGVANISVTEDLLSRVSGMMESMNYIIWLVIISAGALAFVVLFNLSNINITERQREIATIKVLGFYRRETSSYVFRENMVLTLLGSLVGLPFGYLLHRFVMSQIKIDLVSFNVRIAAVSYILSVVLTFVFAFIVELFMRKKIDRIDMAESLKSIE